MNTINEEFDLSNIVIDSLEDYYSDGVIDYTNQVDAFNTIIGFYPFKNLQWNKNQFMKPYIYDIFVSIYMELKIYFDIYRHKGAIYISQDAETGEYAEEEFEEFLLYLSHNLFELGCNIKKSKITMPHASIWIEY